ncbi:MAG: response regulator [Proteobacteria bacterium]|nr:response regulator [Pseudomonadota bacterium]
MGRADKVNILLVDDQPAKLISYEVMLAELGENLIKASSAREALECLLKNEIAVLLVDVCMPELDGFQLAAMVREHPRFQKMAIIFISAIHLADDDRLRGYQMGAVDYMPVPVVPEILRAKVNVFAELYRKTRQLEDLNRELEQRVAERTAELEGSNSRLVESERRRSMALAAGQMGAWDWDLEKGQFHWDDEHCRIVGVDPMTFQISATTVRPLVHPDDWGKLEALLRESAAGRQSFQLEARFIRPDGEARWCVVTAAASFDGAGKLLRMSGVTADITERKRAEERHALLAREVDHRAKNALSVVQSIVRLTRAPTTDAYVKAIEGRIATLSHAHTLLSESRWQGASLHSLVEDELAPYGAERPNRVTLNGTSIKLEPAAAQSFALVLHELATNSAKYGALSSDIGTLDVTWERYGESVALDWLERGGPPVTAPSRTGFGMHVIRASVETQLRGTVSLDWRKEGLHCTLTMATNEDSENEASSPPYRLEPSEPAPRGSQRVLLVEDEALIAMMMQDALTEIGVDVVGPCGRVADAMKVAKANTFSAAILDVNLGSEPVYEVAEFLTGRGIPFIFMTGYGRENIDTRFASVPVLRKPVNVERLRAALAGITSAAVVPLRA